MQSPASSVANESNAGSLRRIHSVLKSVFSPRPDRLKQVDGPVVETIEKTAAMAEGEIRRIRYKHASVQTTTEPVRTFFYGTDDVMTKEFMVMEKHKEEIRRQKEDDRASKIKLRGADTQEEDLPKLLGNVSIRRRSQNPSTDSMNLPRTRKRFIKFDKVAVLLDAAANGDLPELRSILEGTSPLHIDSCNSDGNTALHSASSACQSASISYLLSKGAHVNAIDSLGNTPLHMAASKGDLTVVQSLIQAGANVEAANSNHQTAAQSTPFSDIREYLRLVQQRKTVSQQVTAIYDFNKHTVIDGRGDEVSVQRGELLMVIDRADHDWWLVQKSNGERGFVPRLMMQ